MDPSTAAESLVDFFTLDGASVLVNGSGGSTAGIVTGTVVGGSPMLGVCRLDLVAAGDELTVLVTPNVSTFIINDQTVGPYRVNIRLVTSDPQTDPVNQSTLRLGPNFDTLTPMFIAANITFGNNTWHCHSSAGNFDTGIPVDTTKPHQFTIDVDPTVPLTTWSIDGVVVHTEALADAGAFQPFVDTTGEGANPTNTIDVDWIYWRMNVNRNP